MELEKDKIGKDVCQDKMMMRRALQLALCGEGSVSPNPMVGAVITDSTGRIIGEGWHRRCGEGHAEVNAIASVKAADEHLLREATMYVSLEPCSHYGKTPPCARLLIDKKLKRVVVACMDPNPKVSGRGIKMLREAGIEVVCGVLESEAKELNRRFMTYQTEKRPFVTLKWARSADGFIDRRREKTERPEIFSNGLSNVLCHRQRALHDAIAIGSGTAIQDRPSLTCRFWPGRNPLPIVIDRRGRVRENDLQNFRLTPWISDAPDIEALLHEAAGKGISSVLVEGGHELLQAFIDSGLWDVIREEVSHKELGSSGGVPAPVPQVAPYRSFHCGESLFNLYSQNFPGEVKNL